MQVLFCKNINPNLLYQLTCNKYHTEKTVLFLEYPGEHGFYYKAIVTNETIPRLPPNPAYAPGGRAFNIILSHYSPLYSLSVICGSRTSVVCFAESGKNSPDHTLP